MLAGELLEISNLILEDYKTFQVPALLDNAIHVASNRASIDEKSYRQMARELRQTGEAIIKADAVRRLPLSTRRLLEASGLSPILPSNIAKTIIVGFPENRLNGISSSELGMYKNEVTATHSLLQNYLALSERLNIEEYHAPDGQAGLELRLPRPTFENNLGNLGQKFENFDKLISAITELTTGSRESTNVVSVSTSDLVAFLSIAGSAIYGVLEFYSLFLDVVEKQINIYKAIRDLRGSGLPEDQLNAIQAQLDATIKKSVDDAVENAFSRVEKKVPEHRENQLKIEIKKSSSVVISDIRNGARLQTRIDNENSFSIISDDLTEDRREQIQKLLEHQQVMQTKIDAELMGLEKPILTLTGPSE